MSSLPARTASTLSAASDVPYFSHGADTTKISRPPIYPLSGKTGSDEYARGDAVISYLDSIGRDKVRDRSIHTFCACILDNSFYFFKSNDYHKILVAFFFVFREANYL